MVTAPGRVYDRPWMTLSSARVAGAILAAGLVAVTAGCGGGGGKNPSTTLSNSTTVTLTKTSGGGAEPAFATAGNCQAMAGLAAKAAAAIESTGNAAAALQTESAQLRALAKAAPSDIRGDFQTFASAFSAFLHTLQANGYKLGSKKPPTPAQAAAFAQAAKSFDTPGLKRAEAHLSTWARRNCAGVHVGG